mgnify:CR=1 FL=1
MAEKKRPYDLHVGDVADAYASWPSPTCIISDGAYGVRGFHGDTTDEEGLVDWYAPHIEQWTKAAAPGTALWFWGTEVGWATVHPELKRQGWDYVQTVVWDKGLSHIAGNVNGNTIRRFPVVTEVCVYYTRTPQLPKEPGSAHIIHMKEWLLAEWKRTGMPVRRANDACGVKDAAVRKYFDQGWLWYWPPVEMMMNAVAEHTMRVSK